MNSSNFGFHNIQNADGIAIAITGILIVFAALTIISLFIALLPKMLGLLAKVVPEEHHHAAPSAKKDKNEDALLAAIGFGLYKTMAKREIRK